jgi:hypothetical protein
MFKRGDKVIIVNDDVPENDNRCWFIEGKGKLIGIIATFIDYCDIWTDKCGNKHKRYAIMLNDDKIVRYGNSRLCLAQHIQSCNITLAEYQKIYGGNNNANTNRI